MTVTEFEDLNPEEFHLVPEGATGFPVLLAKAVEEAVDSEELVKAEAEVYKKDYSAQERRRLAHEGNALPNGSYPIGDKEDLHNAAILARSGHGDVAGAKRLIARRAKELGVANPLDDDDAEKAVSISESESQTREVNSGPVTACDPSPADGGEPKHIAAQDEHVDEPDGHGDTAPDKDVPRAEAESQTNSMKADGDGTGDTAPDKDLHEDEAESQTSATDDDHSAGLNSSGGSPPWAGKSSADTDPGSDAWEHKDVELGEQAEALASQLEEVARTFTEREKTEGEAGKARLGKAEGAIRQAVEALQGLLETNTPVSKEIEAMDTTELMKLLDERDAARRDAKKQAKKAKAQKAAEKDEAAKAADAAKATEDPVVVEKAQEIAELKERLAKLEAQPMPTATPFLNAAGLSAVPRGSVDPSVFKALEERVENARTLEEAMNARQQLAMAKMISQENDRERNPGIHRSQWGPNAVPLFKNTGTLPEDRAVGGI